MPKYGTKPPKIIFRFIHIFSGSASKSVFPQLSTKSTEQKTQEIRAPAAFHRHFPRTLYLVLTSCVTVDKYGKKAISSPFVSAVLHKIRIISVAIDCLTALLCNLSVSLTNAIEYFAQKRLPVSGKPLLPYCIDFYFASLMEKESRPWESLPRHFTFTSSPSVR